MRTTLCWRRAGQMEDEYCSWAWEQGWCFYVAEGQVTSRVILLSGLGTWADALVVVSYAYVNRLSEANIQCTIFVRMFYIDKKDKTIIKSWSSKEIQDIAPPDIQHRRDSWRCPIHCCECLSTRRRNQSWVFKFWAITYQKVKLLHLPKQL